MDCNDLYCFYLLALIAIGIKLMKITDVFTIFYQKANILTHEVCWIFELQSKVE